jgi:DNA-binding transcriptional ArsR family regulator
MSENTTRDKIALRRVFEMQCQICKSMAHPVRLEIVERLHRREMSAADLLEALETSKANLSKHMNLLVAAGIVEQKRNGRQVSYSLAYPEIHEACTIMRSILFRRLKQGEKLALALSSPARR